MPAKTRKTYKRRPTKNIMLSKARYMIIIQEAKASGYQVSRGPRSQIGAWLSDASQFYAKSRAKTIRLAIGKEKKRAVPTSKRVPDGRIPATSRKRTSRTGKSHTGKPKKVVPANL